MFDRPKEDIASVFDRDPAARTLLDHRAQEVSLPRADLEHRRTA